MRMPKNPPRGKTEIVVQVVELEPLVVTIEEAMTMIGVSRQTLYQYIKLGQIQVVQLGKRSGATRVRVDSLREFVDRKTVVRELRKKPQEPLPPGVVGRRGGDKRSESYQEEREGLIAQALLNGTVEKEVEEAPE